jgi:hypothetical protein
MGANQLLGMKKSCGRVAARGLHRNVRAELLIYEERRGFVIDSGLSRQKFRFATTRFKSRNIQPRQNRCFPPRR